MGYYDDVLEHHGILGQKWGVRRFENKNGTLTPAGRKRYTTDANGDYQKVKKSLRTKRLEKAANAAQRDADDLRKHGYTEEADAVQKVADKNRAKAEVSANKKGLTDKQKKVIIAGAAIAGTALAAYGGYKLYQLNEKAKEGMSKEYHNKAVKAYKNARWLDSMGDIESDHGRNVAQTTGHDSANKLMELGKSYWNEASLNKDLADQYDFKAHSKKYSVKEKYNYLKTGKVEDSALSKLTKSQIGDEQSRRAGLKTAADAVTKAQKSSKTSDASLKKKFSSELDKKQDSLKRSQAVQAGAKDTRKTTPSMDELSRAQSILRNGKQSTSKVVNINGSKKFSQAAKANDDLVNDLLKKNAQLLKGF
jgi:hypothetical protein